MTYSVIYICNIESPFYIPVLEATNNNKLIERKFCHLRAKIITRLVNVQFALLK